MSAATGARSPSVARSDERAGRARAGRSCSRPPPSITATLERTSTVSSCELRRRLGVRATCSVGTRTSPTPPIASTVPPTRPKCRRCRTRRPERSATRPGRRRRAGPVHLARCSTRSVPDARDALRSGRPAACRTRWRRGPRRARRPGPAPRARPTVHAAVERAAGELRLIHPGRQQDTSTVARRLSGPPPATSAVNVVLRSVRRSLASEQLAEIDRREAALADAVGRSRPPACPVARERERAAGRPHRCLVRQPLAVEPQVAPRHR